MPFLIITVGHTQEWQRFIIFIIIINIQPEKIRTDPPRNGLSGISDE